MPGSPSRPRLTSSETIRAILTTRGLSLAQVSRESRIRFAGRPLFHIAPNFYDALRHASFSPSLHQLYALSVLTAYRLEDWLQLFGFSLDDPARFQACWRHYRTVELDARISDRQAVVPWFEERYPVVLGTGLTSLSHWLSGRAFEPIDSLSSKIDPSFRYLQIGSRDAYAFPDLLPGSIVRIDSRVPAQQLLGREYAGSILAIEQSRGVLCSTFQAVGSSRIVLCPRQLPYAPIELELGTEAKILGVVDLEIRRIDSLEAPAVTKADGRVWKPEPLKPSPAQAPVGDRLRQARIRSGMSFREASHRTEHVARILRHPAYFCSPGALSDLEARNLFPRHVHKLISLSAIYCISIEELMQVAGLPLADAGKEPMPSDWKAFSVGRVPNRPAEHSSAFLRAVEDQLGEIPLFLRNVLPELIGLPNLSVRDLFWAGSTSNVFHPYLRDSAFLAINRKSKTPAPSLTAPVWAQPLYVLELRDGNRLCAACSLQNGTLIVRPCTSRARDILRFRNQLDAEVLGKVIAIARRVGARVKSRPVPG